MDKAKQLGPVLATMFVAGNMIGSGVYLLPASLGAYGSMSLIGWLGALAAALVFAATFAWIGAIRPHPGGLIGNIEDAFGRVPAFVGAALYWLSALLGDVAVLLAITGYLATLVPGLRDPVAATATTVALGWVFVAVNLFGARAVGRIEGVALVLGLLPVALAGTIGWLYFDPHVFAASWNVSGGTLSAKLPEMVLVILWSFLGLESAALAASYIRDPRRNVPLATLGGVLLAAFVYIAACTAIEGILPAGALARSTGPFADVTTHILGASLGAAVAVCALWKTSGTMAGWVLLTAESGRLSLGLAEHRMAPPAGPPVRQLIASGVLITLLTLATASPSIAQQFSVMANATVLTMLCLYAIAGAALVRLSRGAERSGIATLLGGATVLLVLAIVGSQDRTTIGLTVAAVALALVAYPLLRLGFRRRAAAPI